MGGVSVAAVDTIVPARPRPAVRRQTDPDVRRFTYAALGGVLVGLVPFLWTLWYLWSGTVDPLRTPGGATNLYDLQAEALMHGHLWVGSGLLGIEAFKHGGQEYTYFGVLPSLLRIPILEVAPSLLGRLTAPSMLSAWVLVALFSSLLVWRVRRVVLGSAVLGRAEAASYGVLLATITGGSVLVFLAATPWVYNEDLAWSVALTIASLFALLGVLERPSLGRVAAAGVLVLGANLTRLTTGWGCALGAVLVAGWFALGRGGAEKRRWALPMLGVGLVALGAGCAINFVKFGTLLGLPMAAQTWTHHNLHRRLMLAANGGRYYNVSFLPTTVWAYFRPTGLRFESFFPFVTLPAAPLRAFNGAFFDVIARTPSFPATTPLLFLLGCWAAVLALGRRVTTALKWARIILLAAAVAPCITLVWGYIDPRYLADFLPLFAVGAMVALVDLWRRFASRPARVRTLGLGAVVVLGAFSMAANVGMAITPTQVWNTTQAQRYVSLQKSISDVTGHPLASDVVRGRTLPYWGPAGQLFVAGDCTALYVSNGEDYSVVPEEQAQHWTWVPVEYGPGVVHTFDVTVRQPDQAIGQTIDLVSTGRATVQLQVLGPRIFRFWLTDPLLPSNPDALTLRASIEQVVRGQTYRFSVVTDQVRHIAEVFPQGSDTPVMVGLLASTGAVTVHSGQATAPGASSAVTVVNRTGAAPAALCHSLLSETIAAPRR